MTALVHSYFVDEAGDLTLFNKKGKTIVGNEGVSKTFMVGVAHIPNPEEAHLQLEELRKSLLADPYFKNVPSLRPGKKTAICFHAKDDLPEVRREVFKLLPKFNVKVQVALRRKAVWISAARLSFNMGRKFQPNSFYDELVKRLFKNLLHKADENIITFSHRGKTARTDALEAAITKARNNFEAKQGVQINSRITIHSAYPSERAGLQIIDYYLWALQRLYERGEDRFFAALAGDYRLIMDLDDTRKRPYGEWYSDSNPLQREKIKPVAG